MMSVTLIEFYRARLAELEAGVREALRTEDYGVSQFDLDDIESKRRIVDACERVYRAKDREYGDGSHDLADEILDSLASVYSDHPDHPDHRKA